MPVLTPAQQAAVLYVDGDASILAGAGSGKTLVLVEKVAVLVEKLHIPLERILVVTYTDKAAGELQSRIARRLGLSPDPLTATSIETVHAFAASVLRREGSRIGIPPDFQVMDDPLAELERLQTVRGGLLDAIEQRDPEAVEAVQRFGLHRAIRFFTDLLARPHKTSFKDQPLGGLTDRLKKRYHEKKRSRDFLDFNDLEKELLRLLDDADVKQRLQETFRWILIDEFQDINPVQWEILSRIHNQNRLVIVGDPRQSIYRFRGAAPELFSSVTEDIVKRGGRLFQLRENFRSTPAVIECVNSVAKPLFAADIPPLMATRDDRPGFITPLPIDRKGFAHTIRAREAAAVASHLMKLREEGHLWKTMALLFRTRKGVSFFEKEMSRQRIPFVSLQGEPLLEQPEVVALLLALKRLLPISEKERRFVDQALAVSPIKDLTVDLPADRFPDCLDAMIQKAMPLFPEERQRFNCRAFQDLSAKLVRLGVSSLKELTLLIRILREEEARLPCPEPENLEDGVRFLTVHASKGLEFPIVVLCDLAAGHRTSGNKRLYQESDKGIVLKEADPEAKGLRERLLKGDRFQRLEEEAFDAALEESKRLLYVALTRAREGLILPLPCSDDEDRKSKSRNHWADWLKAGIENGH